MAGSSIFVTYGLKSGGGPAFLRRTRTAFGQRQTRTATGSNFSSQQRQRRNGTGFNEAYAYCNTSCNFGFRRDWGSNRTDCFSSSGCNTASDCQNAWDQSACQSSACQSSRTCNWNNNTGICTYFGCSNSWLSGTQCSFSFGGWHASACTPSSPSCSVGANRIECRDATVSGCRWINYTGWSNVSSCAGSVPGCNNGVTRRDCQTIAAWGSYTDWAEAETCDPITPSLTIGAVQTECMAN